MQGFTLLELLFVMAISAIFALFSYPSYQNYLHQVRRKEGELALYSLAEKMEFFYTLKQTYASASIATGSANDIQNTVFSENNFYVLKIIAQNEHYYRLLAAPTGIQSQDPCGDLTLDSIGQKSAHSADKFCWR